MSAEFEKNLWTSLSPVVLVLTPIVLLGSLALLYVTFPGDFMSAYLLLAVGSLAFAFCTVMGSYLAADSLTGELRSKTWAFQRVSPMSAWSMTWGKLFGATAGCWYSTGICLVLAAVLAANAGLGWVVISKCALFFVLLLLFAYAFSLFLCLLRLSFSTPLENAFFPALISVIVVLFRFFTFFGMSFRDVEVAFYSYSLSVLDYGLGGMAFLALWAVVGVYRLFRRELCFSNTPFVYLLFLVSLMALSAGVNSAVGEVYKLSLGLDVALITGLLLCYHCALIESNFFAISRFFRGLFYFRKSELLHHFPLSLVTFFSTFALALSAFHLLDSSSSAELGETLGLSLFVLRDLFVIMFCYSFLTGRLILFAFFAGLYIGLPCLFVLVGFGDYVFLVTPVSGVFESVGVGRERDPAFFFASSALQCALAFALLLSRALPSKKMT